MGNSNKTFMGPQISEVNLLTKGYRRGKVSTPLTPSLYSLGGFLAIICPVSFTFGSVRLGFKNRNYRFV